MNAEEIEVANTLASSFSKRQCSSNQKSFLNRIGVPNNSLIQSSVQLVASVVDGGTGLVGIPGTKLIDRFACRQLDRIESIFAGSSNCAVAEPLEGPAEENPSKTEKTLRFCIDWLTFATGHLDAQLLILSSAMAHASQNPSPSNFETFIHITNTVKR